MNDRRGVGTMIAVSFMVLIFLSGFGVYLFMFNQMGSYQESVESMNRVDWERSQEKVAISDSRSTVIEDWGGMRFKLAVINEGYEDVYFVYFGVFNETIGVNQYDSIDPPVVVKPGETVNITSTYTFDETMDTGYQIHLVTKRGNIAQIFYWGEDEYGHEEGGKESKGGKGARHGFPYTLLIDMTAVWYSVNQNPPDNNNLTIFLTNLSNEEMYDLWFNLVIEPHFEGGGGEPEFIPQNDTQIGLADEILEPEPIYEVEYNGNYTWNQYFTIPVDGILRIEILGETSNWQAGDWILIKFYAQGHVYDPELEEEVDITSNVAFLKLSRWST